MYRRVCILLYALCWTAQGRILFFFSSVSRVFSDWRFECSCHPGCSMLEISEMKETQQRVEIRSRVFFLFLLFFFNLLRWNDVLRASRNFLSQNCNIPSVLSIFRSITRAKQIINLLLVNNFYRVISYRRVQSESDELLFGHSLWSAINCQGKWSRTWEIFQILSDTYGPFDYVLRGVHFGRPSWNSSLRLSIHLVNHLVDTRVHQVIVVR